MARVNHVAAVSVVWAIVGVLLIICIVLALYYLLCARKYKQKYMASSSSSYSYNNNNNETDNTRANVYSDTSLDAEGGGDGEYYKGFTRTHARELTAAPPPGLYYSPVVVDVFFDQYNLNGNNNNNNGGYYAPYAAGGGYNNNNNNAALAAASTGETHILVSIDFQPYPGYTNSRNGGGASLQTQSLPPFVTRAIQSLSGDFNTTPLHYHYDEHRFLLHHCSLRFAESGVYVIHAHTVCPRTRQLGAIHSFTYVLLIDPTTTAGTMPTAAMVGGWNNNNNNNNANNQREIELFVNRNGGVAAGGGGGTLTAPLIQPPGGFISPSMTPITIVSTLGTNNYISNINSAARYQIRYSADGSFPNTVYSFPFYLSDVASVSAMMANMNENAKKKKASGGGGKHKNGGGRQLSELSTQAMGGRVVVKAVVVDTASGACSPVAEAAFTLLPAPAGTEANNNNNNKKNTGTSNQMGAPVSVTSFIDTRAVPAPSARIKTSNALLYVDESKNPPNTHTMFQIITLSEARRDNGGGGGGSPKIKFSRRRGIVYKGEPIELTESVALVYAWTVLGSPSGADNGENSNNNNNNSNNARSVATIYDCTKFSTEHTKPKQQQSNNNGGCRADIPPPILCVSCEGVELTFDDIPANLLRLGGGGDGNNDYDNNDSGDDVGFSSRALAIAEDKGKDAPLVRNRSARRQIRSGLVVPGRPFIAYTLNNTEPMMADVSPPACAATLPVDIDGGGNSGSSSSDDDDNGSGSDTFSDLSAGDKERRRGKSNRRRVADNSSNNNNNNNASVVAVAEADPGGAHTVVYTPGQKIKLTELSRKTVHLTARVFVPLLVNNNYNNNNNKGGVVALSSYSEGPRGAITTTVNTASSTSSAGAVAAYCVGDVFHRGFFFDPHH